MTLITRATVGRIAERIAMNEIEARGYRVTDLNKEGLSANSDFLAAKGGQLLQIQVKGAAQGKDRNWWAQYGFCDDDIIKGARFFNRKNAFYRAGVVVLIAMRSLKDYRSIVLPVEVAEKAAQINLDRYYRTPKLNGEVKKPGKVWTYLEHEPKYRGAPEVVKKQLGRLRKEQRLISPFYDERGWDQLFP